MRNLAYGQPNILIGAGLLCYVDAFTIEFEDGSSSTSRRTNPGSSVARRIRSVFASPEKMETKLFFQLI
jgi:hypothetical protein